jgi:UDP-glucose 4-epimerase
MNNSSLDINNSIVAVTGGAGFIGCHLVARLLKAGAKTVKIIDSFEYGSPQNLEFSGSSVEVHTVRLGAGTREVLIRHLQGVDYLFHLAAEKHNQSLDNPLKVIDANISGTYELLAAARDCSVKKVVFTSSLYAYGRMSGSPFVESEIPKPQTVYGLSKLAGENLCHHFQIKFGLPCMSLRYLFVYGPKQFARQGYKSVIVKNFERILLGQAPIINGDGQQALDYTFVDDVVELTLRAMVLPVDGEVVNICSGRGISVLTLTELMQGITQTKYAPTFASPDATQASSRVGDPSRMHSLLQYRPAISLEVGLRTTFEWMKLRRELI